MKKMITLALTMMVATIATAMSYTEAREEALFLSDKMAYELGLTDDQYDAVYEINLDYLLTVDRHSDVLGVWWQQRNASLRQVLTAWQYDKYAGQTYFYRPVAWQAGAWLFSIYAHYDRGRFLKPRPRVFISYRGGSHIAPPRPVAAPRRPLPSPRHPASPAVRHQPSQPQHSQPSAHGGMQRQPSTPQTQVPQLGGHRSGGSRYGGRR